jgi:uncharacterized protein YabN with tetrapyrrole methylase and pyrophosphatase domain
VGGSLVVVGTGIMFASQITLEARAWIERSEQVFFLVNEPASAAWIQRLNPRAESLGPLYAESGSRLAVYRAMVEHILAAVRQGAQVCAVFYGHPGVLVTPSHQAIEQARREGFPARMLPGISAEACLFADLAIDPARHGCQSFDATDFLLRRRRFDPTSNLVLWQVGVTGELAVSRRPAPDGLRLLAAALGEHYPADHEIVLYEAAQYPGFPPELRRIALANLPAATLSTVTTLYVPPRAIAAFDTATMERLGIGWHDLVWEQNDE